MKWKKRTHLLYVQTKLHDLTAYHDLAEEILQQTKLAIDYVFVGVESGATLTGIAQYLKKKIPGVKVQKNCIIYIYVITKIPLKKKRSLVLNPLNLF